MSADALEDLQTAVVLHDPTHARELIEDALPDESVRQLLTHALSIINKNQPTVTDSPSLAAKGVDNQT